MHSTISFWFGNSEKVFYEKVMTKRRCKKGWSSSVHWHLIRNWFLVCKLGYSRKKMGVEHILFWEKQLKFLGLLFDPWKFWTKQSYSSKKNPAKLYDTYWDWNQILCGFFFIAPENFSYFLFSPRKFHIVFLQYSLKIQVLK